MSWLHSVGTRALALAFIAMTFAGCSDPAASPREDRQEPPPYQAIEHKVGPPTKWHGTVGSLEVQYVSRWANFVCYVDANSPACLPGNNEYDVWVWGDAINKIVINLTWTPAPDGSEELYLAVLMWDWNNWEDPEEEIKHDEGKSMLQVILEGDVVRKRFTIRVDLPQDSDFVMKQEFDVEITRYNNKG